MASAVRNCRCPLKLESYVSCIFLDMKGDYSIDGAICNRFLVSSVACVVCELQRIKNNNNNNNNNMMKNS